MPARLPVVRGCDVTGCMKMSLQAALAASSETPAAFVLVTDLWTSQIIKLLSAMASPRLLLPPPPLLSPSACHCLSAKQLSLSRPVVTARDLPPSGGGRIGSWSCTPSRPSLSLRGDQRFWSAMKKRVKTMVMRLETSKGPRLSRMSSSLLSSRDAVVKKRLLPF